MEKVFWFDCETTGLDPERSAIIQLAALIEIDGKIEEEINFFMQPPPGSFIDKEALKVNKKTTIEIMKYPSTVFQIEELKKKLARYVERYDPEDKFVCAGYNVNFDIGFLRSTFLYTNDEYYGSWFFNCPLDIWTAVALAILKKNLRLGNYKLTTVCKHYDIDIRKVHNALDDIKATRQLYKAIVKDIKSNGRKDIRENHNKEMSDMAKLDQIMPCEKADSEHKQQRRARYNRHL